MDVIKVPLYTVKDFVNKSFAGREPWQIVSFTAASVYASLWFWDLLTDSEGTILTYFRKVLTLLNLICLDEN